MDINQLILKALEYGASDLHIKPEVKPVLRINGTLKAMDGPPFQKEDTENLARQILSDKKFSTLQEWGEVDVSLADTTMGIFRINVFKQLSGYAIAIRVLDARVPTMEELELPETVTTLARRKQGLILVTGPTGSGKSTTLASMINLINNEKKRHVITLEDPFEYIHENNKSIITQREIGRDSASFPGALRAALRQDPDVILVGEMRDLETMSIAVTAAETGHLVLSTLHTIDAAQTVERIVDVFPPNQQYQVRVQLANSLAGILSQRLLNRADGSGEIAAFEVLVCNQAVRNMIRNGKTHQVHSMMQTGSKQGMQTLDKHIQILYEEGYISYDEAMERANDSETLKSVLNKKLNNNKV